MLRNSVGWDTLLSAQGTLTVGTIRWHYAGPVVGLRRRRWPTIGPA